MAQNITLMGASYSAVPAVTLPKTGGGTASFTDVSDTTATAADVASGTYFYTAAGERTEGTASGGGGSTVVITWTVMMGTLEPNVMKYPASATVEQDPDEPWITRITIPENSMFAGVSANATPTVSGLTYQKVRVSNTNFYTYYFFVGTTNATIDS